MIQEDPNNISLMDSPQNVKMYKIKNCKALLELFEKDSFLCFAKWQTSQTNLKSTFLKGNLERKVFMQFTDMRPSLKCQMELSGKVT